MFIQVLLIRFFLNFLFYKGLNSHELQYTMDFSLIHSCNNRNKNVNS